MAVDHSIEPKSVNNSLQDISKGRHLFLYDSDMNSLSTDVNAIVADNNSYDAEMDSMSSSESFDGTDMESYDIDMKSFHADMTSPSCNDHTYSLTDNMVSFSNITHTNQCIGSANKLKNNINSFKTDIDMLSSNTFSTDIISIFTHNNPFSMVSMNQNTFSVDVNSIKPTLKTVNSFSTDNESFTKGTVSVNRSIQSFKEDHLKLMSSYKNPFNSTLFPVHTENTTYPTVEGVSENEISSSCDASTMHGNVDSFKTEANTSLSSIDRFAEWTSMNVYTNPFNTDLTATVDSRRESAEIKDVCLINNNVNQLHEKLKQYSEMTPLHINVQPPSSLSKRTSSSSLPLHFSRPAKNEFCLRRLAMLKNFTSHGAMGLNAASQQGISPANFFATLSRKSSSERRKMVRAKRDAGIKESSLLSEHKHVERHTSCSTHVICPYETRDNQMQEHSWHVSHENALPVLVCVENMFGARESYTMAISGESTDMRFEQVSDVSSHCVNDISNDVASHSIMMSDVNDSFAFEMSEVSATCVSGLSDDGTFSNKMLDISDT